MTWISEAFNDPDNQKLLTESFLIYREIEGSTDRVCAIVTAAWLESRLEHAISWRLADSNYQKKVFRHGGMLGSYNPKVQLGYLIGVYGQEALENFLAIGSIRNRLAHRTYIRDFSHRELDKLFKKLTIYRRLKTMSSDLRPVFPEAPPDHADYRERFIASAKTLQGYLLLDPFDHAPIVAHDPRF